MNFSLHLTADVSWGKPDNQLQKVMKTWSIKNYAKSSRLETSQHVWYVLLRVYCLLVVLYKQKRGTCGGGGLQRSYPNFGQTSVSNPFSKLVEGQIICRLGPPHYFSAPPQIFRPSYVPAYKYLLSINLPKKSRNNCQSANRI